MMWTAKATKHSLRRLARHTRLGILSALALSLLLGGAALASAPDAAPAAEYDYGSQELRVGVWLDRDEDEVYRRGDDLTVSVQTNGDAYVVVYRIDTEGEVSILWPRSRMDDGFVFGGHEYKLPVSGANRIRVAGDEGMGYVEAVASTYPFDLRQLEIDFHHERGNRDFDFYVAGDPFLAMNEVNYAVTGLEDTADYVVTNYAAYYVHEKVDHPRYLCSQCHYDDDVDYHPYRDHCTLEISYDYGWSNDWYIRYGYYPVYWHPTYVYYDPWTWRPWVNYWYYPRYACAPYPYYSWGWSAHVWYDSPYWRGDVYRYHDRGLVKYRSLTHRYDGDPRTKTREYARVSPSVTTKRLEADQRAAMKNRTPVGKRTPGSAVAVKDGGRTTGSRVVRGEAPLVRKQPDLTARDGSRSRPGLRVRDTGRDGVNLRPTVRHTSGGTKTRPSVSPVSTKTPTRKTGVRGGSTVGGERPVPNRGGSVKSTSRKNSGTIKTVEPRKKGTRVWNRGSSDTGGSRKSDSGTVRDSRSRDSKRSGNSTVRPRPSDSGRKSGSKVKSTPRKTTGGSRSKATSPKVRKSSSGSSKSKGSGTKVRSGSSGGSSRSSATPRSSSGGSSSGSSRKSSGGSSKRSSGSRTR